MIAAIMTKPDFAEAMFLVAFIIFGVWFILDLLGVPIPPRLNMLAAGLACLALGFLAL